MPKSACQRKPPRFGTCSNSTPRRPLSDAHHFGSLDPALARAAQRCLHPEYMRRRKGGHSDFAPSPVSWHLAFDPLRRSSVIRRGAIGVHIVSLHIAGQLASQEPTVVDPVGAEMRKATDSVSGNSPLAASWAARQSRPGTRGSSTFWLLRCNHHEYRVRHVNVEPAAAGRSVGAHADLSCNGNRRGRATLSIPEDHEFGMLAQYPRR